MIWPLGLGALIAVALVFRLAYVERLGDFIGADEAVGGLMALKIARGEEFPLLLWEAHYAGTLTSYLGALLFWFFDPTPGILRVAVLPLALAGIAATAAAARTLWGSGAGLVAGLSLALGPALLFAMSSQAVGGYPEVLCFGGLTLWIGARLGRRPRGEAPRSREWALLGAAGGFGTYSLAFVLPVFVGTLWALGRHRGGLRAREWSRIAAGFLLGFSPFVVYNVAHGGASVLRLAGRVLDISRGELSHASSVPGLLLDKGTRYLLGLFRFPGTVWENLPIFFGLPAWGTWAAAVALAGVVLFVGVRRSARAYAAGPQPLAAGLSGGVILGWSGLATLLFLWLSRLDSPRHLFPFYLLGSLGLGALWARLAGGWRLLGGGVLALLLFGNMVGTTADARGAGPRVAGLVDPLLSRGIMFVYTDYFIAYPLVFLSREVILASPAAGPVNVERYPAYTEGVAASARPAYVFRRNTEAAAVFVREMRRTGDAFSHVPLDEFDLYIPDRHVRPNELALVRQF
ncbi:MAG: hypothetical protein HY725_01860 [Candidatus Rokubacteria bacterium]|nr:hypothetical protein [Candidatus Rokubacteria bacterium]